MPDALFRPQHMTSSTDRCMITDGEENSQPPSRYRQDDRSQEATRYRRERGHARVCNCRRGGSDKFDALVAEDASDPIVPAWDNMIQTSEKFLGHRHNYARRMIENRVKAVYTRRDAIVEALTGWALSPKPTEGFLATVKAHNLDISGEVLVVNSQTPFR